MAEVPILPRCIRTIGISDVILRIILSNAGIFHTKFNQEPSSLGPNTGTLDTRSKWTSVLLVANPKRITCSAVFIHSFCTAYNNLTSTIVINHSGDCRLPTIPNHSNPNGSIAFPSNFFNFIFLFLYNYITIN